MTTALGIGGPLIGVIIGAVLTRWIDFTYQRRREIQDAIEAALIVRAELIDTRAGLAVLVKTKRSSGGILWTGIESWGKFRGQLLPVGIPHHDWSKVDALFRHLQELKPILLDGTGELSENDLFMVRAASSDCDEAIEMLGSYAVEGDIPLLSPKRIFDQN